MAAAQEPGPGPLGRGGQAPFPGGRGRLGIPPRDNAVTETGTAKITGRVIAAETGTPIRRAQINVNSRDARFSRTVTTDTEGRYSLVDLPAGRYRLFVNKAGYVALEYGQARPFETGKPLDLADGQALDKIDFNLPRGSAITGRITDEFGDPITDVQVQAMRYQFVNGERQLVNAGRSAPTNDLGEYRLFGLMPGDYVVRASLRPNPAPGERETDTEQVGYPGTYFPGVLEVAQAQTVTLTLGQEQSSIAFGLVPARLARVSGTVMSSDGRPLTGAVVMLRPRSGSGLVALRANLLASGGPNQVGGDGSFRLNNVTPGDYMLEVQQRPGRGQNLENAVSQLEFAFMPLSVAGDIDNLAVVTTAGVSMSGRIAYEGPSRPTGQMQIVAVMPAGTASIMAAASRALGGGRVNAEGTFELRGLMGSQMVRVQGLPAGWAIKSISIDGTDATDSAFEFKPGNNVSGVVITLTDRLTEVTGSVRDDRGQPVMDYVLVAFSENSKLWGAQSRFVQTSRPNQNGAFSLKGLPPGRYLAALVPSLENGMQNDPAVLDELRPRAQSFSLTEGQTLNLNLQMGPQ
jgi:protocatechuate 3,4-dioxygenase beta subunit